jgi:hypothetical protein
MWKRVLLVVIVATTFVVPVGGAEAAPATGRYCVVHVTGQKASGELTVSAPRCYAAYDTAMRSEGGSAPAGFQIGLHCDGFGLGAPCTSVVGTGCTGGWLNVSAAWNNRISSTLSGCPTILHHDGFNLTGAIAAVSGPGPHNLTGFNNRTSSIQYT